MQQWLRSRGEHVPEPTAHEAMHTSHEMAGMATPEQMAEIEALKQQITEFESLISTEEQKLTAVQESSKEEIANLDSMIADLQVRRNEAAAKIPPASLAIFDRIASQYDGEAMAQVEVSGRKQPYTYSCGGCYMSLNAEHANALKSHDAIRQCDNCKRILYMDETA